MAIATLIPTLTLALGMAIATLIPTLTLALTLTLKLPLAVTAGDEEIDICLDR